MVQQRASIEREPGWVDDSEIGRVCGIAQTRVAVKNMRGFERD